MKYQQRAKSIIIQNIWYCIFCVIAIFILMQFLEYANKFIEPLYGQYLLKNMSYKSLFIAISFEGIIRITLSILIGLIGLQIINLLKSFWLKDGNNERSKNVIKIKQQLGSMIKFIAVTQFFFYESIRLIVLCISAVAICFGITDIDLLAVCVIALTYVLFFIRLYLLFHFVPSIILVTEYPSKSLADILSIANGLMKKKCGGMLIRQLLLIVMVCIIINILIDFLFMNAEILSMVVNIIGFLFFLQELIGFCLENDKG